MQREMPVWPEGRMDGHWGELRNLRNGCGRVPAAVPAARTKKEIKLPYRNMLLIKRARASACAFLFLRLCGKVPYSITPEPYNDRRISRPAASRFRIFPTVRRMPENKPIPTATRGRLWFASASTSALPPSFRVFSRQTAVHLKTDLFLTATGFVSPSMSSLRTSFRVFSRQCAGRPKAGPIPESDRVRIPIHVGTAHVVPGFFRTDCGTPEDRPIPDSDRLPVLDPYARSCQHRRTPSPGFPDRPPDAQDKTQSDSDRMPFKIRMPDPVSTAAIVPVFFRQTAGRPKQDSIRQRQDAV